MSYSISASGHITEQEAAAGETPQTPADIEAELAVRLHEILSQPKYGCGPATLYGQHTGTVDLVATNVFRDVASDEGPPVPGTASDDGGFIS